MPPAALQWFKEHAQHHETPHELLAVDLAAAECPGELEYEDVNSIVQGTIDAFTRVADAAVLMYLPSRKGTPAWATDCSSSTRDGPGARPTSELRPTS